MYYNSNEFVQFVADIKAMAIRIKKNPVVQSLAEQPE